MTDRDALSIGLRGAHNTVHTRLKFCVPLACRLADSVTKALLAIWQIPLLRPYCVHRIAFVRIVLVSLYNSRPRINQSRTFRAIPK